jgi:hypothetical protein
VWRDAPWEVAIIALWACYCDFFNLGGPSATRLRGPGVRSVLNAALETGPQDSAPSGATEKRTPEAEQNHGFRVGQMKVSKLGQGGPNQVVKRIIYQEFAFVLPVIFSL